MMTFFDVSEWDNFWTVLYFQSYGLQWNI